MSRATAPTAASASAQTAKPQSQGLSFLNKGFGAKEAPARPVTPTPSAPTPAPAPRAPQGSGVVSQSVVHPTPTPAPSAPSPSNSGSSGSGIKIPEFISNKKQS